MYRTLYRFEQIGEASLHDQRSTVEPTKATPQVEQCRLGYLDNLSKGLGS